MEEQYEKNGYQGGGVRIILPPSVRWSDEKSAVVTVWAREAGRSFQRTIHHVDIVPDKTDPTEPFIIKIVFDLRDRR